MKNRMMWSVLFALLPGFATAKDTYVVVLDASLSMNEVDVRVRNGVMRRMDVAKEALKRTLPNIQGDVNLGIVVFSAGNLRDPWVYPIGRIVRQKVEAAIDLPAPQGGTPLGDYIKIGADALLEKRAKAGNSGRYRLILVTDGESNEGHDPAEWLSEAKRKGVEVDLIGLAITAEHGLARQVVSLPTPGTYQGAQDADALVEAVANVTKEAPVTAAGGIDPLIFEEIGPLPDKIAAAMIAVVSNYDNTLIGEPPPSITVDETGKVTIATQPADPNNGGNNIAIAIGGIVVVVVVFGMIVIRTMRGA